MSSLLRKMSCLLSIFYFNNMSKIISRDEAITNIIKKKLKKSYKKNLKKTHVEFNKQLYSLLSKKKLYNFLRKSFIQKMFFVHNRFFIFKELIKLKKDPNWKFYEKLLVEDNVGNPIRYFLYPKSSGNKINHIYHLSILNDYFKLNFKKISYVFEFGGGYGCMARIFSKINSKIKYCIYDTELVNILQFYYLRHNNLNVGFRNKDQIILKNKFLKYNSNYKKKTLFIANWSLSETPLNFRNKIINIINNYEYIMICYQETFEDINNKNYFNNIKHKIKKKYNVKIILNSFYKGNVFKTQRHYFFLAKRL